MPLFVEPPNYELVGDGREFSTSKVHVDSYIEDICADWLVQNGHRFRRRERKSSIQIKNNRIKERGNLKKSLTTHWEQADAWEDEQETPSLPLGRPISPASEISITDKK